MLFQLLLKFKCAEKLQMCRLTTKIKSFQDKYFAFGITPRQVCAFVFQLFLILYCLHSENRKQSVTINKTLQYKNKCFYQYTTLKLNKSYKNYVKSWVCCNNNVMHLLLHIHISMDGFQEAQCVEVHFQPLDPCGRNKT